MCLLAYCQASSPQDTAWYSLRLFLILNLSWDQMWSHVELCSNQLYAMFWSAFFDAGCHAAVQLYPLVVLDASGSVAVHSFSLAELDAGTSVWGPLSSKRLLAINTHVYSKLHSITVQCNKDLKDRTKELYCLQGQPLPYCMWWKRLCHNLLNKQVAVAVRGMLL